MVSRQRSGEYFMSVLTVPYVIFSAYPRTTMSMRNQIMNVTYWPVPRTIDLHPFKFPELGRRRQGASNFGPISTWLLHVLFDPETISPARPIAPIHHSCSPIVMLSIHHTVCPQVSCHIQDFGPMNTWWLHATFDPETISPARPTAPIHHSCRPNCLALNSPHGLPPLTLKKKKPRKVR